MKPLLQILFNLPKTLLMGLIKAYRLVLSPWLGGDCRFEPTCSTYALEALEKHGAVSGAAFTAYRIVRCQPWCEGGHDPVPSTSIFTGLLRSNLSTTQRKPNKKIAP